MSRGSDPVSYPTKPLGSYHVLPTTTWMDPPSTGDLRRWGALLNNGLQFESLPGSHLFRFELFVLLSSREMPNRCGFRRLFSLRFHGLSWQAVSELG